MKLSENHKLLHFLNELFDTNIDFSITHSDDFFKSFRDDQSPKVTILKCSDSRVQMESFEKTPQNEVFSIRNIGNQISTCEGSVDFGVRILQTPFLLIVGHSACGAIKAAISGKSTNVASVDKEVSHITVHSKEEHLAILENVHNQIDYAMEKYEDLVKLGQLTIFGAVYDFKNDYGFGTGKIVFVSINGESNYQIIKDQLDNKVKNLNFLGR